MQLGINSPNPLEEPLETSLLEIYILENKDISKVQVGINSPNLLEERLESSLLQISTQTTSISP